MQTLPESLGQAADLSFLLGIVEFLLLLLGRALSMTRSRKSSERNLLIDASFPSVVIKQGEARTLPHGTKKQFLIEFILKGAWRCFFIAYVILGAKHDSLTMYLLK